MIIPTGARRAQLVKFVDELCHRVKEFRTTQENINEGALRGVAILMIYNTHEIIPPPNEYEKKFMYIYYHYESRR